MHLVVSIKLVMINCFNVRIASDSDAHRTLRKKLFKLVRFIIVTCPLCDYVVGCSISNVMLSATNQSNRVDQQPIRGNVTNLFRQARSSLS